jgi:glutamine amidotransferase
MSIVIIDYGIGNIKSINNAFYSHGEKAILSRDLEIIKNADGIVLPGVGAFEQGMNNLDRYNLIDAIKNYVYSGKPLLGICLGMQLLLEESEEFGITKGIGLIEGKVVKLPLDEFQELKLPHISWNCIFKNKTSWVNSILEDIPEFSEMYFVHSFAAKLINQEEILSSTKFGNTDFCSSLKKGNIYGCQFHPEKSSNYGLSIIKNFIKICKN